eukprot:366501-Chlamydomonas_euryale.AAC.16
MTSERRIWRPPPPCRSQRISSGQRTPLATDNGLSDTCVRAQNMFYSIGLLPCACSAIALAQRCAARAARAHAYLSPPTPHPAQACSPPDHGSQRASASPAREIILPSACAPAPGSAT